VARAADPEDRRYRVTTLCNLAVIQAKAGNMEAAAAAVEKARRAASRLRAGYPQDYAWFSVALTYARIGRFDAVEAILADIRSEPLRAEGHWRAAEISAQAGKGELAAALERRALAVATAIDNGFERSIMLSDLATAAARAGRNDTARRIFDDALRAGQGLDAGWWRARAYARLATALHFVSGAETRP
jgi:tetratricopeptide (TPR) repeat protein